MATTITVQALPANGEKLAVSYTAADASGMTFSNSGRELVLVNGTTAPAASGVVVEGVAAPDSGRDGSVTLDPGAVALVIGGPYKPRNFNNGGIIELSIADATDLEVAVVRFDANG